MGLMPHHVEAMDYHAFAACIAAYARMNADPNAAPAPPSEAEYRAALKKFGSREIH